MSDQSDDHNQSVEQDRPAPAHLREMRLRPERPPVTRLSRKVLLGLGSVAAIGIAGALFFSLMSHTQKRPTELVNTTTRTTPEGLATLPRDYTGLPRSAPKLGPPLPGDLGKPILNAGAPPPGMPVPGAQSPQQQRLVQERDAARTSHLFATTNTGQDAMPAAPAPSTIGNVPGASPTTAPSGGDQADHKLMFLNALSDHQTQSPDRIEAAPSPYVLQSGAIIPAALITGLRSDLPGEVTAQVTENVYDSPTGKMLLIPQGSRLIGQYDAQVSFGQSRALLVWNRLILPNGQSVVLERQPSTDTARLTPGSKTTVDNHWGTVHCSKPPFVVDQS
jgi:type IV secretory pathway VirB10-like protein